MQEEANFIHLETSMMRLAAFMTHIQVFMIKMMKVLYLFFICRFFFTLRMIFIDGFWI